MLCIHKVLKALKVLKRRLVKDEIYQPVMMLMVFHALLVFTLNQYIPQDIDCKHNISCQSGYPPDQGHTHIEEIATTNHNINNSKIEIFFFKPEIF